MSGVNDLHVGVWSSAIDVSAATELQLVNWA